MKVCIVITHPTQFDVPVFRLGSSVIDVIFTDPGQMTQIYDPEINRWVKWEENNQQGYHFQVLPEDGKFKWLYKTIKQGNYNLVITNGYFKLILIWSIVLGKIYSKKNAIRLDTVGYNNLNWIKIIYKYILISVLKLFIDYFFVVGSLTKRYLLKNGIRLKRILIYGYVSNNLFFQENLLKKSDEIISLKQKYQVGLDKNVVLCISKHNDREAPFDTLKAFVLMDDDSNHLLLVGDGPKHNEVKQQAILLKIQNISFAGYVDFKLLPAIYSIANVFVHDSHNEPWGVSVQEALACNVPVVASDKVGAAYDLIEEGLNGYVFKTGDVKDLASKIKRAIQLNENVLQATNKRILEYWNYETVLNNILAAV